MKIAVGMSGGVDSSVAALLLKRQGHDLVGITMKIWRGDGSIAAPRGNACYGPDESEDIEQAGKLCHQMGIPYHVFDCSERYEEIVLDYFRSEYKAGKTPNPCVRCNQEMKFGVLPALAREAGLSFDKFATGHYARIGFDESRGRWLLGKGVESRKDQSYFIYRLSQEQLSETVFPLGELTKAEVRRIAREADLPVHDKGESQDFYGGSYGDLIGERDERGEIADSSGRVLGSHRGIWRYTIGQRKGLGIAYREPLYVIAIDARQNRIVVGTERETLRSTFTVADCVWSAIPSLAESMAVTVKIRSAASLCEATIEPAGNGVKVTFPVAQSAVTPGQSAVFYEGDIVVGGGIIEEP